MSCSGRIPTWRPTPGWRQRLPRAVGVLLVVGAAACDDQLKYIPTFSSMAEQPSLEAYERPALEPPPGAVALGSKRTWTLLESDSLVSPLAFGDIDLELGGEQFQIFCSVCHGSDARGKGPVVGPNRIPDIPTLDLHSEQARAYTDGYIWGMITNGRGLMPSYRRIPATVRWQVVAYVRARQAGEVAPPAETASSSAIEAE
jgi:mono/diheme cytochrome c family protein